MRFSLAVAFGLCCLPGFSFVLGQVFLLAGGRLSFVPAICADGLAAKATKAAIAARVKLLAPLREVLQPIKPFSGRMEQTAHCE